MTLEEVRALVAPLPRSYETLVRDPVKFRVGRIVYLAAEPDKFLMPCPSDLRYHWAQVRLAAIEGDELRELVVDAWTMVVPKSVAAAYLGHLG